jgi:hypothetical protein
MSTGIPPLCIVIGTYQPANLAVLSNKFGHVKFSSVVAKGDEPRLVCTNPTIKGFLNAGRSAPSERTFSLYLFYPHGRSYTAVS